MGNKIERFRFRLPMETSSQSLATLEDLADHLTSVFRQEPIKAEDIEIFPCHTDHHGWHNHMVSVKARFIAGFTDGPVGRKR